MIEKKISVGTTIKDQEAIAKYCRGCAVELGTFEGGTTRIMSKYAKEVTTIDVFENIELIKDEMSKDFVSGYHRDIPNLYLWVCEKLSDFSNVNVIYGEVVEVADTWTKKIDCIFMDAGHQYESITSYVDAWSKHLNIGAYLLIHDTKEISPHVGSVKFAKELKDNQNWQFIEQCDNIAVFKKLRGK